MKPKYSLITLLLATAAGAATADTGLAGDIGIEPTPFVSTLSRDEVRSSVLAHRSEIEAMHAEDGGSSRLQFTSTLNRADLVADYIAHREEVAAMTGADSGSQLLSSRPRAPAPIQLDDALNT